MLDIIFISYDEPNADINFERLRNRFPHARRVHGVKGIAAAHIAACKKSMTKFFYVVDGDAEILDSFDFSFVPAAGEESYVHIWHAFNPAIGVDYGYGGVKLFSKALFHDVKSQLDFSTTLAKGIKLHEEISCNTAFNSDPLHAFRGAFREAVKLQFTVNDETKSDKLRHEARYRLGAWLDPLTKCKHRQHVIAGARAGVQEMRLQKNKANTLFINDPLLLEKRLSEAFPELDLTWDPTPEADNPMKPEFFFITRVAGIMYDDYVMRHLPLTELRDALSDGQMLSKNWLIQELRELSDKGQIPKQAKVAILGGWIGTLALMMNAFELDLDITSVDLDERANRIAEKLNYDYKFKTITESMYDINYSDFDVIINTSSEHIEDITGWREKIPDGKLLIVQNNNFEKGEGHVSCVSSAAELKELLKLKKVFYEGARQFPVYTRFMLIGQT